MAQNIKAPSSFSAKKAIVGLKELSNPLLIISLNSTELKKIQPSRPLHSGPAPELAVLEAGRGGGGHDGRALLRPQRQPRGPQHDAGGTHQGHHIPPGEVWQGPKGKNNNVMYHGKQVV